MQIKVIAEVFPCGVEKLSFGLVWFASTLWLYPIACSWSEKCKFLKKKSCTCVPLIRQYLATGLKIKHQTLLREIDLREPISFLSNHRGPKFNLG